MQALRIFDQTPDTFHLDIHNGLILCAEWRESITQEDDDHYHALCHYIPTAEPVAYDVAVDLLARCRYTPSEEVALMRKGAADPTDADYLVHEAYITAVKDYVTSLGITEEEEVTP